MSAVKNSLPDDCDYKDYIGWLETKDYWSFWTSSEGGDEMDLSDVAKFADYRYSASQAYHGTATKRQKNHVRAVLAF